MRGIEQSTRGDPAKTELPEKRPAKIKTLKGIFGKPKMKLPSIRRSSKSPTDTFDPIINILPKPEVILTFEENIQQQHFSSAGQQLIHLEESVFRNDMGKEEKVKKEKLKRDYEALLRQIWLAVEASLTFSSEELKVVKSAVSCIQQEEEQDQRWKEEPGAVAPDWRPMQCRRKHDALLQQMVKKRMEETEDLSRADKLSSSLKRDICKMGIRMRDDLLKVVQELNKCYPEEFDICNTYARLYHEAFTEHLMKITEYELDLEDCTYLLSWVNDHYPNDILKHKTLKEIINCQSLGPLLPVEVTEPLEEQYLSDKKAYLETCISNALREEEKTWQSGALPQLSDKHYTSYIAIDVIQCVDKTLSNARVVLGGPYKARSIMCQLKCFLISYKKSLEEFIKGKCGNTKEVVKANLASLEQFKDYIGSCSDFFTDEMRTCCLSIVSNMKECCYLYLSNIIHTDLKVLHCRSPHLQPNCHLCYSTSFFNIILIKLFSLHFN
ncbi:hypothetical protein JZ751_002936 [Albula glossodonta]|uniref:Tumor necrosis factor alpha-induced protein 2 n=1 Tax=Albula glossodonta TaxID=121402 RepID=A0A8T2N8B1_9TELE|nr:hypothetical protein JZ751_002936 [Albula glossodonta]